jgi:hypothetical protein
MQKSWGPKKGPQSFCKVIMLACLIVITPPIIYIWDLIIVSPPYKVRNPWFYNGRKYSWQQNVMLYCYVKMWIVIVHVYFILNVFQVTVAMI